MAREQGAMGMKMMIVEVKNILKILGLVCLLSVVMQSQSIAQAKAVQVEAAWLIGDWILTYDPDGDSEDVLSFHPEGQFVATEVVSQQSVKGFYSVKKDLIEITIGQSFKMQLTHDDAKDKLYFYSKETKKTSYYTKQN